MKPRSAGPAARALSAGLIAATLTACGASVSSLRAPEAGPTPAVPAGLELPEFGWHVLGNGLRVITVENHSHPVVGLTAYVTTGGRTESEAYAGALHFIEHLVFKGGTARFPPTAFRKRIAALGDENGGWTWDDEIQFGFEVPRANFGPALDVFGESLLDLKWNRAWFEDERKVVLQEIEKVSERPWHRLWNAWDRLAFARHPYRRAVIGDAQTVRAQTAEQLEAYYRQRFTPNHLVLALVGDFDTREMIGQLEGRFGGYAPGPGSFELDDVAEPEQVGARRTRMEEPSIQNARFLVGFRTPGAVHPDTPGLMVLARVLRSATEGLPAYLTRGTQWVTSVDVEHTFMVDHGTFVVSGETRGEHADDVVGWLERHLCDLAKPAFSHSEVQKAARALLTERARDWETFGEQAQGLGFWVERMGPEAARLSTRRILDQTPQSLARLAGKYLRTERLVSVTQAPVGQKPARAAVGRREPPPAPPDLTAPGLAAPAPGPALTYREAGRSADVVRYLFDNGLTLLVRSSRANGLVWLVTTLAGGQWVEPADKAGLAVLTARSLTSGTRRLATAQWDQLVDDQALSLQTELSFADRANIAAHVHARDGSTFALGGTAAQVGLLVGLAGEALLRPVFPDAEVEKATAVLLSEIAALPEDNLEFIKHQFYRLAFPDHPYGRSTLGDAGTVGALSAADVRAFHARTYRMDRLTVAVSGRVDPAEVARLVAERWADAPAERAGPLPEPRVTRRPEGERRMSLDRGKDQWCVNIGAPTLAAADPSYPALEVLTAVARGRHFYKYVYELSTSYRSWIKLWPHRDPSVWLLENDVAREGFEDTLNRMRDDLRLYGHGVFTDEDVDLARTRLLNRMVLDAQGGQRMAFDLSRTGALARPFDWTARRRAALQAVTKDQVNALARRVFTQERWELQTR